MKAFSCRHYLVIRTLLHLQSKKSSEETFVWCPPLEFVRKIAGNDVRSDIDILAIQNGKFIIGEAKVSTADFSKKVIDQLIWMGNNLYPDKIIVSCIDGDIEKVAGKIKEGLGIPKCEVISYKASLPSYGFPGLSGLP